MKKPTADVLKEAREKLGELMEKRNAARDAASTLAEKLTDPAWDEAKDGPALELAQRNLANIQKALDLHADKLASYAKDSELEQRMLDLGGAAPDAGGTPGVSVIPAAHMGDKNTAARFSLTRSIRAKYGIRDMDGKLEKLDGVEGEMVQEGMIEARSAELSEFHPDGFMLPRMVAYREGGLQKRDMTVGTTTAGGHTVATDLGEMIGFLDPNTPLARLGARTLTGLRGNISFPRQTARATGYPVAEQGSITESQQTLSLLSLTPKRQGAFTDFSLQLLRQSDVSVDRWLANDLRTVLMIIQEQYAIQGTGSSNQPTGITATSGIGSVAGGTNGLIPAWSHIVGLETEVAADNALRGRLGYLTTPQVAGVLKQIKRDVAGNGFIWEGMNDGGGSMNGYRAATSTLVPSALTKGSASGICHAIIFGNFEELIMAYWGGVEIVLDNITQAQTGTIRITANAFFDVGVRRAQSFAAMLDALIS